MKNCKPGRKPCNLSELKVSPRETHESSDENEEGAESEDETSDNDDSSSEASENSPDESDSRQGESEASSKEPPSFAAYDSDITDEDGKQSPIIVSDDETQDLGASDSQNDRPGMGKIQSGPFVPTMDENDNTKVDENDNGSDDSESLLLTPHRKDQGGTIVKVVCPTKEKKGKKPQVVPSTSTESIPSTSQEEKPSALEELGQNTEPMRQDFAAEVLKSMNSFHEKMDKLHEAMSTMNGRMSNVESRMSRIEQTLRTIRNTSPTSQFIDEM